MYESSYSMCVTAIHSNANLGPHGECVCVSAMWVMGVNIWGTMRELSQWVQNPNKTMEAGMRVFGSGSVMTNLIVDLWAEHSASSVGVASSCWVLVAFVTVCSIETRLSVSLLISTGRDL